MTENIEVESNSTAPEPNSQDDTANETQQSAAKNTVQMPPAFSNEQIDTKQITTDTLAMVPLSPKYRRINIILNVFWGGLVLIAIAVASSGLFFDLPEDLNTFVLIAYGLVTFLTLWSALHHWFADPLKMYALREHDLNYQSGLIFRSLVSQPLLRIQHIEIKRGPVERKAGLSTLQVFSAGGVTHTFYIPGIEHERAIELRQFILDHKDLASDV